VRDAVEPFSGRFRAPAAAHGRGELFAPRRELREAPVRRIDEQRVDALSIGRLRPVTHAYLVVLDLFLVARIAGGRELLRAGLKLFFRVLGTGAEFFAALERRTDQMLDRPRAAQVGIAPFGHRVWGTGRVSQRG